MSDSDSRILRSRRIHKDETAVQKQVEIAKSHSMRVETPHKFVKKHWANCGKTNCLMCMNPRKAFGEDTFQERKLKQNIEEE